MQLEHQENFVVEAMGAEMLSLQTIFKPYSPRNSKETKMWVFLFCFFLRGGGGLKLEQDSFLKSFLFYLCQILITQLSWKFHTVNGEGKKFY